MYNILQINNTTAKDLKSFHLFLQHLVCLIALAFMAFHTGSSGEPALVSDLKRLPTFRDNLSTYQRCLTSRKSGGSLTRRTVTLHFWRILFNTILTYRRAHSVSHLPSFQEVVPKTFLITCLFLHVPALCTCFPDIGAGALEFQTLSAVLRARVIYFWWSRKPYQESLLFTEQIWRLYMCKWCSVSFPPECATGLTRQEKKIVEKLKVSISCRTLFL